MLNVDRTPSQPSRDLLASVARLYYLDDRGQQEIADMLGLSRTKVSRLLSAARELRVVRISVDDYEPRDRELETALARRFGLREAVVVKVTAATAASVRRTIGYFAAPSMAERVRTAGTVGVAGGRTLRELVEAMRPVGEPRPVAVAQLMGNIGPTPSDIDAQELSRTIARCFGGTFYTLNAPAIVRDRATRDVFLAHQHIELVWRMLESLELAFVGIGSPDDSAFVERGVLDTRTLSDLRRAGAVGEICGRFFDAAGRECATEYQDHVIGIGLDALRATPEVVAVTNGADRAPAVRAALAGGLVHSLVIDDVGAAALLVD
jgi:DNA-binding transcriptional regulator LsrR (DeoR family)